MIRQLSDMTWPEVAEAMSQGMTTVILPFGATEQHGPHLPLGTDSFRATALAEGLARKLPDALIAPVISIGCSDEHGGFAGLLSMGHETLAQLIVDCAERMHAWGVQRLILLSAHGGNGQGLTLAREKLQQQLPDLEVWAPADLTELPQGLLDVAHADGITADAVGLHAGEGETSEMLHLRPDLVRWERIEPGYAGDMSAILPALMEKGLQPLTSNGVLGDPHGANHDRGARYLAAEIDDYHQQISTASRSRAK